MNHLAHMGRQAHRLALSAAVLLAVRAVVPWGSVAPVAAQDPLSLGDAAARALQVHPLVEEAVARTNSAAAFANEERGARLPSLQLQAGITRFQEPMIVAPLHSLDLADAPRFDETLVQGRLGASYTLFDGGARGARVRSADAMEESAHRMRASAEMDVLSTVSRTYLGLASRRAVRDAARAMAEALQAELVRAQQQVEAGTAARVQLLRASAALADARAQVVAAESRVGLAERELARLMAVPPETIVGRPIHDLSVAPQAVRGASTVAGDDVGPPRLAAAQSRVDAAAAVREAQGSAWVPRLDANAALLDFGTPTGDHVLEWQAGLQLSWVVFNGGARGAAIRRAEADLAEARAVAESTRLAIASAEDAARTAVADATAQAEALEAAVTQWAEVARIEALALESGAGVQSDLLRAQAGLFQASAGLAQARAEAFVARVELARVRGVLTMEWINQQLESR